MDAHKQFSLEKEMTPLVGSWLLSKGYTVKKEVITSEGVCDLVAVDFNAHSITKRIQSGIRQHLSNDLQVHIWAVACSSVTPVSKMFKMFKGVGIEKHHFDLELKKLIDKKFIEMDEKENLKGNNDWYPLVANLISVELKLHNFQEALAQAKRYREFSTQTYIGMPAYLTDRLSTERAEILHKEGIGLIRVSNNVVEIIIESNKKKYSSRSQFLQGVRVSELFWKEISKTI